MDNMTPIFTDKGCRASSDVKLYPNRIEYTAPNLFFGKHVETIYLKDILGIRRTYHTGVSFKNRTLTACSVGLSSMKKVHEFVDALNSVM